MEIYKTCSGTVVIFLGRHGSDGAMIYGADSGWKHHPHGSEAWDLMHQLVYRNFKADSLTREDMEKSGIPVPSIEEYPKPGARSIHWKENFNSKVPFKELPEKFLKKFKAWAVTNDRLALILHEDTYETGLGDGKSLDLETAWWDEASARKHLADLEKETAAQARRQKAAPKVYGNPVFMWTKFSLKTIRVRADEAAQKIAADLDIGPYEHYSLDPILGHLINERILRDLEAEVGSRLN
ncbi:MAG: hypothetical protein HY748_12090 [Elusimicrobia bacterium]|nr:hypothetical protein [Elusimicrobiota bacterium]